MQKKQMDSIPPWSRYMYKNAELKSILFWCRKRKLTQLNRIKILARE